MVSEDVKHHVYLLTPLIVVSDSVSAPETYRGLPAKTAYLPNLDFFSFWYQSALHVIIFN